MISAGFNGSMQDDITVHSIRIEPFGEKWAWVG